MKLKNRMLLIAVLGTGIISAHAQTLVIDDFDSYADTEALQANWNSFGTAASAGAPILAAGSGVGGSNAAAFSLNWFDGTNANMRDISIGGADLSSYFSIDITMFVETDSGNVSPTVPTILKIAIQSSDSTIWQTRATFAIAPNVDSYTTISFALNSTDMERVGGTGSFSSTVSDIDNIRLRFENAQETNVGQTAYISSIVAVPEPSTYAAIFSVIVLGWFIFRRKLS